MTDHRKHQRHSESLKMRVEPSAGDARTLITANVGDGGIFLLAHRGQTLPVGTEITITPLQSKDGSSLPFSIRGRVVHVNEEGMGIMFLDPSFS